MTSGAWTPALERFVAVGRERGHVTVADINAALPCREVSAEMVEDLLATLSSAGAVVTEGDGPPDDEVAAGNPRRPLSPLPPQSEADAPLDAEAPG